MNNITVPVLSAAVIHNENGSKSTGASFFTEEQYSLADYNGLFITERMDALNFRHRMSEPGYSSSWHVAGDPTLIIIRAGVLRLALRDGQYRDFKAGDQFIAMDRLQNDESFDDSVHGHTAELIGNEALLAVHIKLATHVNK